MNKKMTILSIAVAMFCGMQSSTALAGDSVVAVSAADQSESITVGFLIRSDKEKRLEQVAIDASDPDSSRFGKYLSASEVDQFYRPREGLVKRVVSYLKELGFTPRIDESRLFVEADMTIAQASSLAGVTLVKYQTGTGQTYWAPDQLPKVPISIRGAVETLMGLDQTPRFTPRPPVKAGTGQSVSLMAAKALSAEELQPFNSAQINTGTQAGCPESLEPSPDSFPYTPNQWLHAYGIDQLHANGFTGEGERVALIEIDGFFQTDLDGYTNCYGLSSQTPVVHTVPGGDPLPGPGGETILDLQMIAATAPGIDRIDVYEVVDNTNEYLGKAMLQALSQPPKLRPTVISISLGGCEAGDTLENNALWERANRRAAAQGISVFASTGDQGPTACQYDAPWGRNAANLYSANFPSSSPWVTAVGGTNLVLDQNNQIVQEVPWNNWTLVDVYGDYPLIDIWATNSGASSWFKRPVWQKTIEAVPSGRLKGGRLTPDVALLADNQPGYTYLNDGQWSNAGGTSASTPLMAGGVAVINQALRSQGKRRAGYLTPALYRMGKNVEVRNRVFTDVTFGNNDTMWQVFGNTTPVLPANPKFDAKPGYDGASGWGSPRFPAFLEELRKRR